MLLPDFLNRTLLSVCNIGVFSAFTSESTLPPPFPLFLRRSHWDRRVVLGLPGQVAPWCLSGWLRRPGLSDDAKDGRCANPPFSQLRPGLVLKVQRPHFAHLQTRNRRGLGKCPVLPAMGTMEWHPGSSPHSEPRVRSGSPRGHVLCSFTPRRLTCLCSFQASPSRSRLSLHSGH